MKREIKFRAWDGEKMYSNISVMDITDTFFSLNAEIRNLQQTHELMQFTGLKDRNGKEIYEGDILDDGHEVRWNQLHCGWSMFNRSGFCVDLLADEYDRKGKPQLPWIINAKIIGNIYENPELI